MKYEVKLVDGCRIGVWVHPDAPKRMNESAETLAVWAAGEHVGQDVDHLVDEIEGPLDEDA